MKQKNDDVMSKPRVAIVDSNTLAVIGLRTILQDVMPMMEVDSYGSFSELMTNHPEHYYHYFVAMNIVIANRTFFAANSHKTIVLSPFLDNSSFPEFHSLVVNVPESHLVKSVLELVHHAHGGGRNIPVMPNLSNENILSSREIEVLSLVAQGYINKEIADRLNIGLTTVISHRKNIQEKLKVKSVSALTIYAVMHGYVDINNI